MLKLPHLTDEQVLEASPRALKSGTDIDECPTCGSKPDSFNEREPGTYCYDGEEHECDCDTQVMLRKHYLLANIPEQYMRLDWNRHYQGEEVPELGLYLEKWPDLKHNGIGLEITGGLGRGKTFLATHIGKELVKRGESVFFVEFEDVLSALDTDSSDLERRLRDTHVVILDEVKPPWTERQQSYFSTRFENVIRHRTNWNAVTIITTNLSEGEMEKYYPRVHSLLSSKQIQVILNGKVDARTFNVGKILVSEAFNGERRPIT